MPKETLKSICFYDVDSQAPRFRMDFTKIESHLVEVEVFNILLDDEPELYLTAAIKWDGCSHIYFAPASMGYLHLCGRYDWLLHNRMMSWTFEQCGALMLNFEP